MRDSWQLNKLGRKKQHKQELNEGLEIILEVPIPFPKK
jgi:hypothetical protein